MSKLKKLDHSKNWIEWMIFGVGVALYVFWNRDYPMPLGFVWGIPKTEDTFEVFGSYVPHFARRLGIRTAINKQLLQHFKRIITTSGSDYGGMAFMKATGYRQVTDADCWVKTRPEPEKQAQQTKRRKRS